MICGKHIFLSQTEAKNALRGFNNANKFRQGGKNRSKRSPTNTYFCEACNGWHVETEGKRRQLSSQQAPQKVNMTPAKKKDYPVLHIINNCHIKIR